ncbi:PD-(D/E)XK nuclease family protein [Hymenobacter siberiensis]|uniref:PD-(D/E)XK nuclease family protein n=1 Tax=Hymenobacter siberiensis TaxID=2848396 RepID=UPI001C1DFA8E|nr:PD-(D/E)XK nuclease family protein [Hymenobacter siberiensis]
MMITAPPAPTLTIQEKLQVFADPRFRFDPGPHRYFLGERELTSATTWLKQFSEPFIREERAAWMEAKYGRPAQEYLDEWDRAGDIGTKTHQFIEDFYNHQLGLSKFAPPLLHGDGEVSLRCLKFLELQSTRLQNYQPVGQEIRLFHEAAGVCGTLDFLAEHTPTGKLYVLDWKTSKKIDTDQDKIWRNLKRELRDIADNEHNKYSLQISLYRVMLEEAGIETAGGAIVWLPTGGTAPRLFTAIDYRHRVRPLLGL